MSVPPPGPPFRIRTPRVPLADVIGRTAEDAAAIYRADGFQVQVIDLNGGTAATADLRLNRIRLIVKNGRVVRAHQG